MSLQEVQQGQAQSLAPKKLPPIPFVPTQPSASKVVIAPQVATALSKTNLGRQVLAQFNVEVASAQPSKPVSPVTGPPAPPPKDNYVPPPPGITTRFDENNELVTRVTLRPGEGSNLRWEKTETTPTSQGYELKGYTTSLNKTEGIEPARKMTSGEIISSRFTKPGHDIFYGKQTGPENIALTAGDVRLTTGPSTKAIMTEIGANLAVTLPLGSITRISMGAAQTLINPTTGKAIGTLGKFYQYGVKPAFIGTGLAGGGAFAGYTAAQLQAGKTTTRQASIDVLNLGVGLAAFGVTGGAPENMWSKIKVKTPGDILTSNKGVIGRIKNANQLGLKTGKMETNYNNIRIGRRGELLSSDTINLRQNILDVHGGKIGEQIIRGVESDFISGSGKAELFIDFPGAKSNIFNKQFNMYSVGGSQALNKIIPGVERPVQTDVFTTMKYRTGELQGVIKTGKIIKYTKLAPEFTPYVDNAAWGFKKTPLKFEKASDVLNINKPKLNLKSNAYTGGSKTIGTTSGGLALESQRPLSSFEKALLRSEIEQPPIFNVYPPTNRMTPRLGPIITPVTSIKTTTQTTADYAGVMSKRFTSLGFKTDIKTERVQASNRDTSTTKTARARLFGTGLLNLTTPKQTTRTEQRQSVFQTTKTIQATEKLFMTNFGYQQENIMRRPPYVPGFPLMGLTGGGEGGRGSDDWDRYFRKRKFNIGSINQAFGIGMKPMKIKGGKKQWAF